MSRRCKISGKRVVSGHNVSHANNKTKRVFRPNLQNKKIYIPELGKSIRLRVATSIIKTIDKLGVSATLKKFGYTIADLKKL